MPDWEFPQSTCLVYSLRTNIWIPYQHNQTDCKPAPNHFNFSFALALFMQENIYIFMEVSSLDCSCIRSSRCRELGVGCRPVAKGGLGGFVIFFVKVAFVRRKKYKINYLQYVGGHLKVINHLNTLYKIRSYDRSSHTQNVRWTPTLIWRVFTQEAPLGGQRISQPHHIRKMAQTYLDA